MMNPGQVQVDCLLAAGNMLEWHDNRDAQKPGLLELTGISQHGRATMSGLNDYDYQSLKNLTAGHFQNIQQVRTISKAAIPNEILEHFKHIKCHCTMGLFPEVGRAWLTIDSEIYIWTYENAWDVAYYDGLSHLIVSVGLIKPKEGVFVEDLKYLLLLTTPIEIVVLGVTFGGSSSTNANSNEMQLMTKPIFVLGTDNVPINVIRGSRDGRIFLGGRDGCLYEIFYQAELGWFGGRCKKINLSQSIISYMIPSFLKVFSEVSPIEQIVIDDDRNLLYVLTEKSSIEAWDIGKENTNTRRLGRITQADIATQAVNLIKTVDPSIFKGVKAICPINSDDEKHLHLLAVTQCGVRFYFSTTSLNVQQQSIGSAQSDNFGLGQPSSPSSLRVESEIPKGLYLLHVRLPPGYTPNATTNKPKQVHAAHYSEGAVLMVTTQQQEQDILWSISSKPFTNARSLVESTVLEGLDGIVWSLAEMQNACKAKHCIKLYNDRVPRRVALLTNQGTHIVELLKSSDILQQILLSCNGPHHEAVKVFFQTQTEQEACISALLLATSEELQGRDIALWATQAFLLYGGEPSIQSKLNATKRSLLNPAHSGRERMFMSTPMPMNSSVNRSCASPYGQPISPIGQSLRSSPTSGNDNSNPVLVYSAKHDGLYLYVTRMLRNIWQLQCVNNDFCSNLNSDDCELLLLNLRALRSFLEVHSVHDISSTSKLPHDSQFSSTDGYNTLLMGNNPLAFNEQRNVTEQAQIEEKRSLSMLNQFVRHACEVISLWNILNMHAFQLICMQLSPDNQKMLRCCTFRDLLLARSEVCAFLIISLINLYLKDKANVTEISTELRELCPNLYRHEDAVVYKATEILMTAKNCSDSIVKEQKLLTALQLCKDAAPTLPLHNICQQFIAADFYEGVVELVVICASKSDPEQIGIHYYNNDEPAEDREGYTFYATRMNDYKEVQYMLDHLDSSMNGSKSKQEPNNFSKNFFEDSHREVKSVRDNLMSIISKALTMKDPLLHVTVYEWLLTHGMFNELLNLTQPSLGDFLRRSANRNSDNVNLIDLLWKYYEKIGQHSQAAQILDNLTLTRSEHITLDMRIKYLVRAVMCMRNEKVGSSITNGIFLKELEDKLEISRVQKAVLNHLTDLVHINPDAPKAIKELNYSLYDITQLYQNYAEPFHLWECQLMILNCSHHNDPLLIESVWTNIISSIIDSPGSSEERGTTLFSKLEMLKREFGESGACFPLAFIIRELEIRSCQIRLPKGTVPEKLVAMGIDIELLLEYYSRMISMNERIWANEGNEWHLIQSATRVVSLLADNPLDIVHRSKRRIIGKAQDIVAVCLNICYQKPDTNHLQLALKELQIRLQRTLG